MSLALPSALRPDSHGSDHTYALYLQSVMVQEFLTLKGDGETHAAAALYLDELGAMSRDTALAQQLSPKDHASLNLAQTMSHEFVYLSEVEARDAAYVRQLNAGRNPQPPAPVARPAVVVPSLFKLSLAACSENEINVHDAIVSGSVSVPAKYASAADDVSEMSLLTLPPDEFGENELKPAAAEGWCAPVVDERPIVQCVSCYRDLPGFELACDGHAMCSECLGILFIKATTDSELMPPRCCKIEIDMGVALEVLKPDDVERFEKAALETLTPLEDKMYCTLPTCSEFILLKLIYKGETGGEFSCPACSQRLCSLCRSDAHFGISCDEAAKAKKNDLSTLFELAGSNGWKQCTCGQLVELTTGCNIMTCKCKRKFCYVCEDTAMEHKCPRGCDTWDEDNLLERARHNAEVELGRNVPANVMDDEVENQMGRMLRQGQCEHRFKNRCNQYRQAECTGCEWVPDVYIASCRYCNVQVCGSCKRNRYGY